MKKLISIFVFFIFIFGFSQTHRFIYEYQFKRDSLADYYDKENMNLDINPDEVKFYPYSYLKNDSLNKLRNYKSNMWDDLPAIKRKINSDENISYILLGSDFFMIKTTDKINWELTTETKIEKGYKLQKATAKFGGRNWEAWFCKEINLNEGPYKFRGLPGLVFQIEDSKKNFIFSLIKSYKLEKTYVTNDFLESFAGKKPILISEKILKNKLLEFYNDPLHDFREQFKNNTDPSAVFKVNNIQIKNIDQFKELTEIRQKSIRKENNPIEIDKAIIYRP
ncbi:MAG: GLPGLI family protein [Chryseobacterium sp.]|nr:MAG: GLPGLI family protein [Chryseobacterium sp.]